MEERAGREKRTEKKWGERTRNVRGEQRMSCHLTVTGQLFVRRDACVYTVDYCISPSHCNPTVFTAIKTVEKKRKINAG